MINILLSIILSFLTFKGLNYVWNKIFKKGRDK